MRQCGLARIEHRMNVRPERGLPLLIVDLADILECRLMRRIVHGDIDAAQHIDRILNHETAVSGTLQIPGTNFRGSARFKFRPCRTCDHDAKIGTKNERRNCLVEQVAQEGEIQPKISAQAPSAIAIAGGV